MKFCGLSTKLYDYILSWLFLGKEREIRQTVVNLIPNKKLRILDIGCGTGTQLIKIKTERKQEECYGVDSSTDMLRIANRKAKNKELKINFSYQNFSILKFKNNFFDFVIAFLVLHEVDYKSRKKAIQEIARVLKKNGKLIIVDYAKTRGFARAIQKLLFFIFKEYGDNFIETKEILLKNFKKIYSKKIFDMLSLEYYVKMT